MIWFGLLGASLLLSIFLYLRGENFRKELVQLKRIINGLNSESRSLLINIQNLLEVRVLALKQELADAQKRGSSDLMLTKVTEILVGGASQILLDSLTKHKTIHESFRHFLGHHTDLSYDDFKQCLANQETAVQTAWLRNDVASYLLCCQLLIAALKGQKG